MSIKLHYQHKIILGWVVLMYALFFINTIIPYNLNSWGVIPRSLTGFRGLIFSPFLHANLNHIISNTIPLVVLLFLLATFYPKKIISTILIIMSLGGLLVWVFGRGAIHVGASGVIYGLASFLIFRGFKEKSFVPLLVSVFVILVYGSFVFSLFPTRYWISWESHLFGAIAGYVASISNKTLK